MIGSYDRMENFDGLPKLSGNDTPELNQQSLIAELLKHDSDFRPADDSPAAMVTWLDELSRQPLSRGLRQEICEKLAQLAEQYAGASDGEVSTQLNSTIGVLQSDHLLHATKSKAASISAELKAQFFNQCAEARQAIHKGLLKHADDEQSLFQNPMAYIENLAKTAGGRQRLDGFRFRGIEFVRPEYRRERDETGEQKGVYDRVLAPLEGNQINLEEPFVFSKISFKEIENNSKNRQEVLSAYVKHTCQHGLEATDHFYGGNDSPLETKDAVTQWEQVKSDMLGRYFKYEQIRSSIEKLDKDFRQTLERGSLTRQEKNDLRDSFQKKLNEIQNGYKDERAAAIREQLDTAMKPIEADAEQAMKSFNAVMDKIIEYISTSIPGNPIPIKLGGMGITASMLPEIVSLFPEAEEIHVDLSKNDLGMSVDKHLSKPNITSLNLASSVFSLVVDSPTIRHLDVSGNSFKKGSLAMLPDTVGERPTDHSSLMKLSAEELKELETHYDANMTFKGLTPRFTSLTLETLNMAGTSFDDGEQINLPKSLRYLDISGSSLEKWLTTKDGVLHSLSSKAGTAHAELLAKFNGLENLEELKVSSISTNHYIQGTVGLDALDERIQDGRLKIVVLEK